LSPQQLGLIRNMSVYGELSVEHISPEGLKTAIGKVKGLVVYTPNTKRDFAFKLKYAETVDLNSGKLNITYINEEEKVLGGSQFNLN